MPDPLVPKRRKWVVRLAVLALVLIGTACVLLRPPVPPPVVPVYTPHEAQTAQAHVAAVREEILHPAAVAAAPSNAVPGTAASQVVQHIPQSHGPALVRLQLSEADLNAYLATNPHIQAILKAKGVKALQLILTPPHGMTFRAAVLYRGQAQNVQVKTVVRPAADAPLRLTATAAQVGRLPLPPATVTAQANKIAAQFLGHAKVRLPLIVQQVQVVDHRLVLIGKAR